VNRAPSILFERGLGFDELAEGKKQGEGEHERKRAETRVKNGVELAET